MTVRPRLVPPVDDGPYLQEPATTLGGVVSDLGFRPDQGIDVATAGVGLMPVFQPAVSLPTNGSSGSRRWRGGRCSRR